MKPPTMRISWPEMPAPVSQYPLALVPRALPCQFWPVWRQSVANRTGSLTCQTVYCPSLTSARAGAAAQKPASASVATILFINIPLWCVRSACERRCRPVQLSSVIRYAGRFSRPVGVATRRREVFSQNALLERRYPDIQFLANQIVKTKPAPSSSVRSTGYVNIVILLWSSCERTKSRTKKSRRIMAHPEFKGSITTTGRSEAIRLDKALFKAHPEFRQRAKVRATVIGPGSMLVTLDQSEAAISDEIERDPVVAAYLAFLERDMTERPSVLEPITGADIARIRALTKDVTV